MKRFLIILGLCLTLAVPGWTAIAPDATNSFTDDVASPANISHAFTIGAISDPVIVVGVSVADGAFTITVPQWGGVTMASALKQQQGTLGVELFYLAGAATGTHNVTYTITGTNLKVVTGVRSYSGVHQSATIGTPVSAVGTSTSPITVNVSSAAGELVVDVMALGDGIAVTVGANQSQDWNAACCVVSIRGAGSNESGSGTVTMSWTWTPGSGYWSIAAMPLKPALSAFPKYYYDQIKRQQ